MADILRTKSRLINDGVKFSSVANEKQESITTDYVYPFGEGKSFTSLELFLISLSTCLASTIAITLRKKKIEFLKLEISAEGKRREEHPTCFETITLTVNLASSNANMEDMTDVIKLSEEKLCPVYAMVKDDIKINVECNINPSI